MNNTR